MGSTYETDAVNAQDQIELALKAAIAIKALGHMVGCRSWLLARLAIKEVLLKVEDLKSTIKKGSE